MSKRAWEDFDPNKSDPEDEDYDAAVARKSRLPRSTKLSKARAGRKRQRTGYREEESEDISDSLLEEDSAEDSLGVGASSDEQEISTSTGRPARQSVKRHVKYEEESDEGSIDYMNRIDKGAPMRSSHKKNKRAKAVSKPASRPSLMVKLQLPAAAHTGATWARTSSMTSKKGAAAVPLAMTTRRSSRLAHDDAEGLVALTDSGNHAHVVRMGTRSPEASSPRSTRASTGLKKPPSTILEVDDETSQATRTLDREMVGCSRRELEPQDEDLPRIHGEHSDVEVTATQVNMIETNAPADMTVVPESSPEDDEEEDIVQRRQRAVRPEPAAGIAEDEADEALRGDSVQRRRRSLRKRRHGPKNGVEDTSDFEPDIVKASDEEVLSSSSSEGSPEKYSAARDDSSNGVRRSQRTRRTANRRSSGSEVHESDVADELAEELQELRSGRPKRRQRTSSIGDRPRTRTRKPVDYRILRPETNLLIDDDGPPAATTPSRRRGGGTGGWQRGLFSTYGPFGGAGGPPPVFGSLPGATGGVESDSSDDDTAGRSRPGVFGGITAATPTAGAPPGFGLFPSAQTHSADPLQSNLGKVKDRQALADADPLGVDQNVKFDGVGGLQGHIDQLKEMVMLPLLYPEVFQRFHITPPRGVLFHGPPGTGKTLMARALASSVSSEGHKVTFYMRKGADALSKWVGEAERQLRLLFEEARKNQPSIIFFDEIDGLAPVRSSKQEQIHASIVSTLLALMDGMDGRGQVIVIGATNRPDSVDPALRRPGRFDREFYFPLPDQIARRSILDIHTTGWEPPLSADLKDQLAAVTKGYGGADLRALCTEAALNSVQRTYPQIYKSTEKRLINPENIHVTSKDFMMSLEKIVPSSERSVSSGQAPLPKTIVPLLQPPLKEVIGLLGSILPQTKRRTALEEAEYEESRLDKGLSSELMQQDLERARVFRPRLLVRGAFGMGQQYLASAILNYFEGVHVQNFDLATMLGDSTRSAEAAVVQLFAEVKRHKPSVIYIPSVDVWYQTMGSSAISTFLGLLRSLSPTDPILVLGIAEGPQWAEKTGSDMEMVRQIFGYSSRNQYQIRKPAQELREKFFAPLLQYLNASPSDFPNFDARKKRALEDLPLAPKGAATATRAPSKAELKAQRKKDRQTLNILKLRIQPIMDQIRLKYKKFRTPVIEDAQIRYLFDEEDSANLVTTDLPLHAREQSQFRPFERSQDSKGEPGLLETATGKFYYNMETITIEKRLSNGYYKRAKDFLADIKKLTRDAKTADDQERLLKASELQANVEVDLDHIEIEAPALIAECEALYQRELKREREQQTLKAPERENSLRAALIPVAEQEENDAEMHDVRLVDQTQRELPGSKVEVSFYQNSQQSLLSNGTTDLNHLPGQHHSTSTSGPSNAYNASGSGDSSSTSRGPQQGSFEQSAQTRSIFHSTGGPFTTEQRFQAGQLSQRGALTPLAEGSNPAMYHNSASTTSSDKRNTNSSGEKTTQSTQARLETQEDNCRLDVSALEGQPAGGSQVPDTQSSQQESSNSPPGGGGTQHSTFRAVQSQSEPSQPSQPPAVPKFPSNESMQIAKLVNGDVPGRGAPVLKTNEGRATRFVKELVLRTTDCSVEQLEQVNSVLMSHVWNTKGSWDREVVIMEAESLLHATLNDMRGLQYFGDPSTEYESL